MHSRHLLVKWSNNKCPWSKEILALAHSLNNLKLDSQVSCSCDIRLKQWTRDNGALIVTVLV